MIKHKKKNEVHASFLRNTRRTTDVKVRSLWKVKVLMYCFEWTQKWLMQKHRGRSTQRPEAACVLCLILCTYLLQYVYVFFQMCLSVYVLSDLGGSNCPCITHTHTKRNTPHTPPLSSSLSSSHTHIYPLQPHAHRHTQHTHTMLSIGQLMLRSCHLQGYIWPHPGCNSCWLSCVLYHSDGDQSDLFSRLAIVMCALCKQHASPRAFLTCFTRNFSRRVHVAQDDRCILLNAVLDIQLPPHFSAPFPALAPGSSTSPSLVYPSMSPTTATLQGG